MRIALTTLGCKINQYETNLLCQDLRAKGNAIVPFDAEADVYVINTCSVTTKSDTQSRQTIRAAVKRAPGAKVIVTGCYASIRPDEIRSLPGVHLVVPNADKQAIPDQIMETATGSDQRSLDNGITARSTGGRTRSYLKIQDGCDNRCSYCIVPSARGASRSASLADVLKEFDRLVQAAAPEIVLTGIHIGTYGSDREPQTSLSRLLPLLVQRRSMSRIRLSSIEANEITREIIDLLGRGLCRHLHIPLQSGDDSVLALMKRQYTSGFYRDLLDRTAQEVPGIALGADVIVGFPGEGEREFQHTLDLVDQSPLTHLHVFTFSARPGTPAYDMKHQVPDHVRKKRNEELRNIGIRKNFEFRKRHLGSVLSVVIEDNNSDSGAFSGLTDNYIRVNVMGATRKHIGRECSVRIEEVKDAVTMAKLL